MCIFSMLGALYSLSDENGVMSLPLRPGDIGSPLQPLGGLFGKDVHFRSYGDEPRLTTRIAHLGDPSQVWAHLAGQRTAVQMAVLGAASGLDRHDCFVPAFVEGLERYCSCVYVNDQFIWATANELGAAALDLDSIPRCSRTELSHRRCPLVAPSKDAPMRWVRGLSLADGSAVYLPTVLVYLYTGFASRGERICIPISTGCAAHTSLERALLSAILEVVERDAISLTWLLKLPLPRILIDQAPLSLQPYWERCEQSSVGIEYLFFDATTDLGIPTVYGLQISSVDKRTATLVSCSTAMDPNDAVAKVIRDMAACRIAFRHPRQAPLSWDDFNDVFDGATYMARAEQAGAFDFLVHCARQRTLSTMPHIKNIDERQNLKNVLLRLHRAGLNVYAVELSTDEALRAGIRVVRVLIPGLQPLSFCYRARYLGHPRLYQMPRLMGYTPHSEANMNHWPQPFC